MSMAESTATDSSSTHRCSECEARLVHDQRYCLECGARRGPLPAHLATLIGAIHEQGPAAALPAGAPLADSLADMDTKPQRLEFAMPGPRAAAVAVMGMLGFGVIVGSLAGGAPVETLANAPLIVVGLTHPAASTPPAATQVVTTIVDSVGGAAPAAASPAAPAPQPAVQASASPATSPVTSTGITTTPATSASGLPPVKHVFLIVLSDRGFTQSFGGRSGYLSAALRRQGELVQNYYAVAGAPLANEIALISGQGPTAQTASDCPVFSMIRPGQKGARGQVLGTGCAYPPATKTLAGQLTSAGHTWKAYVAGAKNAHSAGAKNAYVAGVKNAHSAGAENAYAAGAKQAYLAGANDGAQTACRVPKPGSQQPQLAGAPTDYLAWRNPFLYFRSLTAGNTCRHNEVGLGQLATDLKRETTTPSLAYIIAAPCATGSEVPCKRGADASLTGANQFLKSVVPQIKRSAAYKNGGLIAVTFDQAPQTGADADPSACCNSPSYPNLRQLPAGTPAPPPAAMGAGSTTTTTPGTTTTTPGTTTTTSGTTSTTPGTTSTTPGTTTAPTDSTTTTPTDSTATTTPTDTTPTGATTPPTGATIPPTTTTTPAVSLGSGETTPTGGGGHVGLLLISPYVKANSTDVVDYFNHFSLLASIENLFGLHRLGYAGVPGLPVFGLGVYNAFAG